LEKIKTESINFLENGIPDSLPLYGNGHAAELILSSIKSFFA
jgi:hypothetical protein